MRRLFIALTIVLSACAGPEGETQSEDLATYDSEELAPASQSRVAPAAPPAPAGSISDAAGQEGGPNVSVTAAPGVAFNYRYAFRLTNARISPAQEAHASMCEKLGIARCRITGMRYSVVNERDVSASLELKLDPAIARAFGKEATKVVIEAEGMLVEQQITGVDAAASIERANRSRASLEDQVERINRELARPGLSNAVRDRLLSEANSVRSQIRAFGEQREADEESLAKTPMVFHYGSGRTIPGFDEPQPLRHAFDRAAYNFLAAIGFLIVAIASLLPWIVLAALGYLAYRRLRPRWALGEVGYRVPPPEEDFMAPEPRAARRRRPADKA